MSIFASRTEKTLDIPGEPGQTAVIRALAGRHLDLAGRRQLVEGNELVQALGGAEYRKQVAVAQVEAKRVRDALPEDQRPGEAPSDPIFSFDQRTLVYKGLKSWTLPESLKPETVKDESGKDVTEIAAIEDLSAEAREFFARAILRLTKPSLFEDWDAAQAAQVKDSRPSIDS